MSSSSKSTSNSKKPVKAHRVYTKMSISLQVGAIEMRLPFTYFPNKKELDEVIDFVLQEIDLDDPPALIDLSDDVPYAPNCIEFPDCDHAKVRCGKFYGGICKGIPKVNTEHLHTFLPTCGFCLLPKANCLKTGNSTEFVCPDCCLGETSSNFCMICDRFEETDDDHHCGKCQYILLQDEEKRCADINSESDCSSDSDEEKEVELTLEGYAKDGFVVSDSEQEMEKNVAYSSSFNQAQWDLINEPI